MKPPEWYFSRIASAVWCACIPTKIVCVTVKCDDVRLDWQCIKRMSEVWHLGFELENGQESTNGSGTANATSGLFFGHYFGN